MLAISITIQHCSQHSGEINKTRNEKSGIKIRKKKQQIHTFADKMITHLENTRSFCKEKIRLPGKLVDHILLLLLLLLNSILLYGHHIAYLSILLLVDA